MTLPQDHALRMARARRSLDGLSVGDAFGQQFFVPFGLDERMIAMRAMPGPEWDYTDDTVMALAIVEVLEACGRIDQDALAAAFAAKWLRDPDRGYGETSYLILQSIAEGQPWREVSPYVFDGSGSMGNGGAMRAAPVGAYFADDLAAVVEQARLSAEVTHAHPEGQAGAIAVAATAAIACSPPSGSLPRGRQFLEAVAEHTPDSLTREGILEAARLKEGCSVPLAVAMLGNGSEVLSQDTVPFALWCAAGHLDDFVEAMWQTVSGLGDRDTTCAMAGGVVALAADVPADWLAAREPLETMSG